MAQAINTLESLAWQLSLGWMLVAQQDSDNLFSNFRNVFNHFIESGQVWALLIGFALGYLFRNLTAY